MGIETKSHRKYSGFTIVELVIAVAVLGILASLTVVGYGKWRESTAQNEVQSDLRTTASAMENAKNFGDGYPTDNIPGTFKGSSNVTIAYKFGTENSFCIDGVSSTDSSIRYFIDTTKGGQPTVGVCTFADGTPIQAITTANCPESRIRAVDARDNHTYWVQKLADGKCWMLTNLAYGGGGTNTYGDVRTLINGTSDTKVAYFDAKYYVPSGANPTTEPASPSASTDGGTTGAQYGYLYNFCGANAGQTSNGACSNSSNAATNPSVSVCPTGWRLPTGNGGEFGSLNDAINSGSTSTGAALYSAWLAQRSGSWSGSFYNQGSWSYYWSSSQYSTNNVYAYGLVFSNYSVQPTYNTYKYVGYAVRCVAI